MLAAGGGSRFGGGKLVADFGGRPLIARALDALKEAPVDGVFVIVGDKDSGVPEVCAPYGFELVENPAWRKGQATSVLAGLRAVEEAGGFGAAVVVLADQPLVGAEAVGRLVRTFRDGARVAVATYSGRPRNPVLFEKSVWEELGRELHGDEGARSFLRGRPDLVVEVECQDIASPADVDTREDLEDLKRVQKS